MAIRDYYVRAAWLFAIAACSATYPEGTITCKNVSECPAEWSCRAAADASDAGKYCFSQASTSSPTRRDDPKDAGPEDAVVSVPPSAAGSGGSPRAGAGGSGRAGAGGSAGTQPAAGGKKAPPAADGGDDDAGPTTPDGCGDTQRDRDNCGECSHVCSFANAEPSCNAGSCAIARCDDGYADCDGDAANGCEAELDTAANCGACGVSCETDSTTLRACNAGSCGTLQLSVGEPEPIGSVNGSLGGDVYTHVCPPGEIITGLEIAVSQSVTYGFSAKCSAISLTGTFDAPQIAVGPPHLSTVPVGGFANSVIEQADCPENTVVTATSGSLIMFSGETRLFIKTVLLACSRVSRVTPSWVFVPERLVPSANSPDPGDGSYSETCGPGQVLTGFTGYAGAAIDGLQAHCSTLNLLAASSTAAGPMP